MFVTIHIWTDTGIVTWNSVMLLNYTLVQYFTPFNNKKVHYVVENKYKLLYFNIVFHLEHLVIHLEQLPAFQSNSHCCVSLDAACVSRGQRCYVIGEKI